MTRDQERRNRPALALHVPEPDARPGDELDFSHIRIPAAGSVARPDVSVQAADIRDLPYTLIARNGEGDARRATALPPTR